MLNSDGSYCGEVCKIPQSCYPAGGMAVPEHVLVVDLEEPHGPGADDEVGNVDAHVEEQEPRAASHPAPFPTRGKKPNSVKKVTSTDRNGLPLLIVVVFLWVQ